MASDYPVFSEREINNILATRKVCRSCNGTGKVREEIATQFTKKNYPNGTASFIIRCHVCGGCGTIDPNQVADVKMAAAGGAQ